MMKLQYIWRYLVVNYKRMLLFMCNVNMHCKTDILTDEVSERHIDIKYVDEGS